MYMHYQNRASDNIVLRRFVTAVVINKTIWVRPLLKSSWLLAPLYEDNNNIYGTSCYKRIGNIARNFFPTGHKIRFTTSERDIKLYTHVLADDVSFVFSVRKVNDRF